MTEGGFFTGLFEHIGEESELFLEEEEFFDFLDEYYLSYGPVMGDRVFSEGFDFLSSNTRVFSWLLGTEGRVEFFNRGDFDGMSGGELREEVKDRVIVDIDLSFELRKRTARCFSISFLT